VKLWEIMCLPPELLDQPEFTPSSGTSAAEAFQPPGQTTSRQIPARQISRRF
jgi:hypothetical protein